jgi:hypothetical protein
VALLLLTATSTPRNPGPQRALGHFPTFSTPMYGYSSARGVSLCCVFAAWPSMSDKNTLGARIIDRCLRPLFPAGYSNEVQVGTQRAATAAVGVCLQLCVFGSLCDGNRW